MAENRFKTNLNRELKRMFPGCIILHMDPTEIQGIPDLLILYRNKWAALEGKDYADAPRRPNQDYYVDIMNGMSFSAFVYPENQEDIINKLIEYFGR